MKATARAGQHESMLEPLYPWGCGGGGSHTCSNSQSYPEEMKKWKLPFLQSCADPAHQIPFTSSPARSLSSVSTAGCRSVSPPPICTSRPNTQPNNTYLKKKKIKQTKNTSVDSTEKWRSWMSLLCFLLPFFLNACMSATVGLCEENSKVAVCFSESVIIHQSPSPRRTLKLWTGWTSASAKERHAWVAAKGDRNKREQVSRWSEGWLLRSKLGMIHLTLKYCSLFRQPRKRLCINGEEKCAHTWWFVTWQYCAPCSCSELVHKCGSTVICPAAVCPTA